MSLVTITGTVKLPSGAAYASAVAVFRQNPKNIRSQDGSVIAADAVRVTTDGSGNVSVALYSGPATIEMQTTEGLIGAEFIVPDGVTTANLAQLLLTPSSAFSLIGWAEFQALVAATMIPYADVATGLAASAESGLFIVALTSTMAIYRDVGGVAVPVYIDI